MRIPAKGKTKLAAAAGKLIGEAKATQEAIERSERVQERLQSIDAQKELAKFNQQLAIDRAKFHAAMNLEEEKRARQWQLEKMELASRIDFEESERKRAAEKAEYEAGIRLIQESENLTDTQKADAIYKFNLKKQAGYTAPSQREEDPIKTLVRQKIQAMSQPTAQTEMQLGERVPTSEVPEKLPVTARERFNITKAGQVIPWYSKPVSEWGKTYYYGEEGAVPSETASQVVLPNRIRVISPDGRTGTILENEWPQYESAGFRRL
jgi:hypothetical protein